MSAARYENRPGQKKHQTLSRFNKLMYLYNRYYQWTEGFGCVVFPTLVTWFIFQLPYPSWIQIIGGALFLFVGIIWAMYFASLLGKLAFFFALIAGMLSHLDWSYAATLTAFLAVIFFVFLRVILLLFSHGKRLITRWLSLLELSNMRISENAYTPEMLLSTYNRELLLKAVSAGVWNVDHLDEKGRKLLHLGVERGDGALVKELLQLEANPDLEGTGVYQTLTPLCLAVQKQYIILVDILLQYGASPCESPGQSKVVKQAVLKGNYFLLLTILHYISWETLVTNNVSKDPTLHVGYSDTAFPLNEYAYVHSRKVDLISNYIFFLKCDPAFWMKIYQRLFTGQEEILRHDAGYLMVFSHGRYAFELSKTSRTTHVEEETISVPVGLLRASDQLEKTLCTKFSQGIKGEYVFPSDVQTISCERCEGQGAYACPAGCNEGFVKCKKPDCVWGRIKCNACDGKGYQTIVCPECSGGYRECEKCDATGYLPCSDCNGEGQLLLQMPGEKCDCSAENKVICHACSGTGKKSGYICSACGGEGLVCQLCTYNQREVKSRRKSTVTCGKCKGTGIGETCSCSLGKIVCENCQGAGEIEMQCIECNGRGAFYCSRCNGKGMEQCPSCKGEGVVECQKCGGSGNMFRVHDTCVNYYWEPFSENDYQIYLPAKQQVCSSFSHHSPFQIDQACRGKYDLYRVIMVEGKRQVHHSGERHSPLLQHINNMLAMHPGDEYNRTLKEIIDVMPLKYDEITLASGTTVLLVEERDVLSNEASFNT